MIPRTSPDDHNSVCITGVGAFCAAGDSVDALWQSVVDGRVTAEWFDDEHRWPCVRAVQPRSGIISPKDFDRLDRFAQLGLVAAEQAVMDAGLINSSVEPSRVSVIVGTSRGPVSLTSRELDANSRVRPTAAAYSSVSSLAAQLSTMIGARGSSLTVSATCASSAAAIALAAGQIRSGTSDIVLVGGAEAPLYSTLMSEMAAARLFARHDDPALACRPFDVDRNGIVVGEGAAFLVLESAESASRRNVTPVATVDGWATVCDAGQRSGMSDNAQGVDDALRGAIDCAGIEPDEIDAVHLHGTGTKLNDEAEARIIRQLFAERAAQLPCTSTKAVTGHCLGASGALQAVINVRSLQEQALPPTTNCFHKDDACAINVVREPLVSTRLETILSHSAGFWGNHVGIVYGRVNS